jgi:hypothetical protein
MEYGVWSKRYKLTISLCWKQEVDVVQHGRLVRVLSQSRSFRNIMNDLRSAGSVVTHPCDCQVQYCIRYICQTIVDRQLQLMHRYEALDRIIVT